MKWACAILLCPALLQSADAQSLLLPANNKTLRLQLTIRADGQSPEAAHEAFLDRLFDFFDRDGDGALSPAEAGRLFPLPGPDGRGIAMDFAKLDANHDGMGSRTEFKAFYRHAGFTPVVAVFAPAGADMARANLALFNRLDRNGDGRLSRGKLEKAASVLRAFDANEDETIEIAELLVDPQLKSDSTKAAPPLTWSTATAKETADGVLIVDLGKAPKADLHEIADKAFTKEGDQIRFRGGALNVNVSSVDHSSRLRASRDFYLAPFQAAAAGKAFLDKKAIDANAELAYLAPLVQYADRDGDGLLSLEELRNFLDLIEAGVRSQIAVRIVDEEASLFAMIDENRDGKLDRRELSRAVRLLPTGKETLERVDIPRRVSIEIEAGAPGKAFGPVMLAGKPKASAANSTAARPGPKWFQAMDRNGDGFLSPSEFLGPPEVFAALDADGDGFISVAEAERAKR